MRSSKSLVKHVGRYILCLLLGPLPAIASIDLATTTRIDYPQQELDKKYTYQEMCSWLPENIVHQKDSTTAVTQFADRSLQLWWNSPEVQSAAVARTTDRAEKKLRADVTVRDENKRDHRFSLKVGAVQGLASIKYSGFTNLEVRYEARIQKAAVEVSEKIGLNKKIILGQYLTPIEASTGAALRWQF